MFKRSFDSVAERVSARIPMGPRKKSKPNPEADVNTPAQHEDTKPAESPAIAKPLDNDTLRDSTKPSGATLEDIGASLGSQSTPQLGRTPQRIQATQKQLENRASWYGSWKGKARPVADIVRDHVPGSPATVPSSPRLPQSPRDQSNGVRDSPVAPSPRRYMSGSLRKASRADVLPASTSNLSVVSDNTKSVTERQAPPPADAPEAPLPPDPDTGPKQVKEVGSATKDQRVVSAGWFGGWWSRPDGYVEKAVDDNKKDAVEVVVKDAQQKPLPESPAEERTLPRLDQAKPSSTVSDTTTDSTAVPADQQSASAPLPQRSSWFWSWSSQQNAQNDRPTTADSQNKASADLASSTPSSLQSPAEQAKDVSKPSDTVTTKTPAADTKNTSKAQPQPPRKSTGWAFWSREEADNNETGKVHKQVGEIAVADTPSQSRPEAVQYNETEVPQNAPKDMAKAKPKSVRGRPTDSPTTTPAKNTPSGSPERKTAEPKVAAVAGKPPQEQPKQAKESSQKDKNILLPEFSNTYSILQQPSIWAQLRRLFISDSNNLPGPHLHLTPNPPRIKKALAIGVHGFFPSPIYQKILGQPTGTSIRFANCAAQAIKNWTETRGYDCEIEKVALEGEGFIFERVDTLWKLLLNWIDHIRQADFILVACHSQGVPVAIELVAKLIAFGCVSNARIGICAMAGINLGPFAEYKTRIFGGSALELFEFANPASKVSESYRNAVEEVLKSGVRIVYVGSIDDQLVSLESSTFAPLSHPAIYRAVFIDGRLHTSDFLTSLIGFAFKLRNLGLPDHGLIRELSPALAGSLYSGEGHSSLHHYMPIYDLAVRHALETVTAPTTGLGTGDQVQWGTLQGPPSVKDANPYFLPWAMRGILEEEAVRRSMGEEVEELLRLFEEWKPVSKGLKDIKFRLEAVRSKL